MLARHKRIWLVIALAVVTGGCVGQTARERVTLPATLEVAREIWADVVYGVTAAVAEEAISSEEAASLLARLDAVKEAFATRDRATIVAAIDPELWGYAQRGILARAADQGWYDDPNDDDDIPEGAESLLLRLETFIEAVRVLGERI